MRLFLLVACILSVTITTKGQSLGDSDHRWNDGIIYYTNGGHVTGLISRNITGKHKMLGIPFILYKTGKKADEQKIGPEAVRAFICGPASFVVAHNINDSIPVFVKVLMDEPVKLFEADKLKNTGPRFVGTGSNTWMVGGDTYSSPVLFFGEDADHVTQVTRKNFKDAMNKVLVKRPALLEKINSKEYEYEDLEQIVNFYNGMRLEDIRTKN